MNPNNEKVFRKAVASCQELPGKAFEKADEFICLQRHIYDQGYISRLDAQIAVRGDELKENLIRRKKAIATLCGKPLIRGTLWSEELVLVVEVDPDLEKVVYWEEFPGMAPPSEFKASKDSPTGTVNTE